MMKRTVEQIIKMCHQKKVFLSEYDAMIIGEKYRQVAYKCPNCGFYHLTKQEQKEVKGNGK